MCTICCFASPIDMKAPSQFNLAFFISRSCGLANTVNVKKDQMVDKASNAAQSAKDSMSEAGQTVMNKAQGAANAVKDATGMKK
ncbi:hypothetical protein AQUCO_01000036v1 [Aquilegia coerulea]|uniref:Stress-induced protein KIN2-like n=1 Tax=Aquilegia coerulea TaxID=218851 RepID=A0A2G5E851_AQUCA|nr:hypothetical protein AQUCO_01000036v1 [Aquilegia coerulea]